MSLLIKKPGILTTVQDMGRLGWRRFGVNPNGPMDPVAARIANLLVGNDDNAALLEMHFPAPEIGSKTDAIFSICGGDFGAELDGNAIGPWRPLAVTAGSTLRFTRKISGERCYIAVRGAVNVPLWLKSASTNLTAQIGGHQGRQLRAGDEIRVTRTGTGELTTRLPAVAQSLLPRYGRFPTVRIIPGAEFEHLSRESRDSLLDRNFSISRRSDRMGFRLVGEPLTLEKPRELISSAVCFGTIQLLPDG
ncbi:MAG TPA: biotin-dependent carboxyltransferase family protein, partial [Pyrinomonadaceae bacterium]